MRPAATAMSWKVSSVIFSLAISWIACVSTALPICVSRPCGAARVGGQLVRGDLGLVRSLAGIDGDDVAGVL